MEAAEDEELQVTPLSGWVELSVKVPVAVNCCLRPSAIDGLAGVTAIETSAGCVTVRVVDPLTVPEVAWIVVTP